MTEPTSAADEYPPRCSDSDCDWPAEVDRLRAWKTDALTVLARWEETWEAAGRPGRLGGSKAIGVRQEIDRLRAEITACGRHAEESSHM